MGRNTVNFPAVQAVINFNWLDANLRIMDVDWNVQSSATIRIRCLNKNLPEPAQLFDQTVNGPEVDNFPMPGNYFIEEYTDPEYPEEGSRLRYPEGLEINIEVVP